MDGQTMPFHPVEIRLETTAYIIAPGDSRVIPVSLTNRSNRDDYFELTIRGVPPGWVIMDIPVIHLAPGESRETGLTISPPEGASGRYTLGILAAAQGDSTISGEAVFDLDVSAQAASSAYATTVAGAVRPTAGTSAERFSLSLDALAYNVIPGGRAAIQVELINNGRYEDTFYVVFDGLPAAWISAPDMSFRLGPGERQEIILYVQPPQSPASRAGRHTFTVRAISQSAPGQAMVIDGLLTVAAFSQFTADLTPRRMDAGQTARLRIFNQGNIQSTYTVTLQSRGQDLEFVQVSPGPVRVLPGENAAVDFAISPRSPNWFGSPQIQPYTVVVTSSEGEAQAYNADIVSRSLVPVWVLPVFLVLCLTALCGVGFLWNWNQNRIAVATATADFVLGMADAQTQTAEVTLTAAALAGQEDADGDGLSNSQEAELGTNAQSADTDGDRLADGDEVRLGTGPLNPDTDGDGVVDGLDIDPLDANNPSITATAAAAAQSEASAQTATASAAQTATFAAQPTLTFTPLPPTNTVPPPTNTVPPPTNTRPAPTATLTMVPPTQTQLPLPVTGEGLVGFESNRDGAPDLYLFNAEDGSVTLLTEPGPNTQMAWSPDGSRIAFTSGRDGNNEIYIMEADGSDPVNLTNHPADDSFPSWSPDGDRIAFATNRDGNYEVYSMSPDGEDLANLTDNPANDSQPAWYDSGGLLGGDQGILFATDRDGNYEIYAMATDGADPTNLTGSPGDDSLPAVAPQGGSVAFTSNRDGNNEVYGMGLDGVDPTNLTNNPASDTMPAWSPDGERIAFATDRDGNPEIYVMNADGSEPANLTRSPAAELYPDWR